MMSVPSLSLGQLQLDAPIAAIGILGGTWINRLLVGEARRGEPRRWDAFIDGKTHHRQRAGGRQFPIRRELRIADRATVGVPVDPQDPVDVRRDLGGKLLQRDDHRSKFFFRPVGEIGASGREQHFRLEYKAVANDANVGALAKYLAQPAEELRAVTSQLLDLVHEGKVEALTEFDDLALL